MAFGLCLPVKAAGQHSTPSLPCAWHACQARQSKRSGFCSLVTALPFRRSQAKRSQATSLPPGVVRAVSLPLEASTQLQTSAPSETGRRRLPGSVSGRIAVCVLVLAFVFFLPLGPASASQGQAGGTGFSISAAFKGLIDAALHLDKHLGQIIAAHGNTTYVILFAIVFAETGLVLTPFLPGDSLLFAAGAFATPGSPLSFPVVLAVFLVAAILGDAANYAIGSYLGQRALSSRLVKDEYIAKTEAFYTKFGGKTIVLARFVPIVRTFAPFVAGVAKMSYAKFAAFNVGGAILWTALFTGAGYYFGNLPFVKENFTLVILAIVLLSVVPVLFEVANERRRLAAEADSLTRAKAA